MRISSGVSATVDITDRVARELGLADLQSVAGGFTQDITRLIGTQRPWWLNELRAGRAYGGQADTSGVAANITFNQLFNPAASGKTLLVYRVVASMGTQGVILLGRYDTPIGTPSVTPENLLIDGAAGVGAVREGNTGGLVGTAITEQRIDPFTPVVLADRWGFQVPAGRGLIIEPTTVNVDLTSSWWWVEV